MAGHLVSAGRDVVVWGRNADRVARLVEKGATQADSVEDLAAQCDEVAICVNRSEDVQQVVEGLTPRLREGSLVVDHSTISPRVAIDLQTQLRKQNVGFVDAPITGGSMGAVNGSLTIFCGGVDADVARAIALVQPYAKRAERVGGPGAGQMMKLANQIAVAGSLLGLCEAMAFAEHAGLDLTQARDLLGSGAAGSWAFEHYGPKILAKDWSPGFSIVNQRKDLAYVSEAATTVGAPVPGTELVDRLLGLLERDGRGHETTAALFDLLSQGRG